MVSQLTVMGDSKIGQSDASGSLALSFVSSSNSKRLQPSAFGVPVSNDHPSPIKQTRYVKKFSSRLGVGFFLLQEMLSAPDKPTRVESFMTRTGHLFPESLQSMLRGLTEHYLTSSAMKYCKYKI